MEKTPEYYASVLYWMGNTETLIFLGLKRPAGRVFRAIQT